MAILAGLLMVPLLSAPHVQALNVLEGAYTNEDGKQACIAAVQGQLQIKRMHMWDRTPGSASGFARIVGVKDGSPQEYFVGCSYDGETQVAEIDEISQAPALRMWVSCDVRIVTHDGLKYDLNTPGDYEFATGHDGMSELNTRHIAHPSKPGVALIDAVAMLIDLTVVEIYASDRAVYMDGELLDVSAVYDKGEVVRITHYSGMGLTVTKEASAVHYNIARAGYQSSGYFGEFDVYHRLSDNGLSVGGRKDPAIRFRGLAGSNDGVAENDLFKEGSAPLSLPAPQSDIERLGAGWLISPDFALFRTRPSTGEVSPEVVTSGGTGSLNDDCTDYPATAEAASQPTQTPSRARPSGGYVQRIVGAAPTPAAAAPEPEAATAPDLEPIELPRGERLTMNGHYLIFQEDGNLCVYREADNGWVWCINNDPAVRYFDTARVRTTNAGQLIGQDAAGVVLYALPPETPMTAAGVRLTQQGALEIYSADGVLWSSAN